MSEIDEMEATVERGRFMDRVAFSMLFKNLKIENPDGSMRRVEAEDVRKLIREGKNLWGNIKDEDWPAWTRRIKRLHLEPCITLGRFQKEFRDRRPDIWQVYSEEPLAPIWMKAQVASLRIHLCIDPPVYRPARPI
jgi:hypothetical protein